MDGVRVDGWRTKRKKRSRVQQIAVFCRELLMSAWKWRLGAKSRDEDWKLEGAGGDVGGRVRLKSSSGPD